MIQRKELNNVAVKIYSDANKRVKQVETGKNIKNVPIAITPDGNEPIEIIEGE